MGECSMLCGMDSKQVTQQSRQHQNNQGYGEKIQILYFSGSQTTVYKTTDSFLDLFTNVFPTTQVM
jgi:hypothetical protein